MKTHTFRSTGEAYDACQCDENVAKGDLLLIPSEHVIGVADTWPFAVTDICGHLHSCEGGWLDTVVAGQGGEDWDCFRLSIIEARKLVKP